MIITLAVVLAVAWLIGMLTAYTFGGFLHVLLGLAVLFILLRVLRKGSKAV